MKLVIYALAVWRLAHMIVKEPGPGDVMFLLRRWSIEAYFVPDWVVKGLGCVSCTSVWTAFGLLIISHTPFRWLVTVLAGSAVAKLLEDYFYEDVANEDPLPAIRFRDDDGPSPLPSAGLLEALGGSRGLL